MSSEKKSFWLTADQEMAVYGEVLPRNYLGEARPPHYIYFKQMIDGDLIKFSTGKTTLAEALKIAPSKLKEHLKKDRKSEIKRFTYGMNWEKFYSFKEKQIESNDVKKSTLAVIERNEDKILLFWKNLWLDKLDSAYSIKNEDCWEVQFEKYVEWFREKYSGQTMFNALKYFNAYNNWMHRNGLIKRRVTFTDPNAKKERKKRKITMSRILTIDEVRRLLEAAKPMQKLAIMFGFFMAFRISDVVNLSWDRVNLDPDDPFIQFFGDDKEETYAKAPINQHLFDVLMALKGQSESPWVFPMLSDPKRPINPQTLYMEQVFAKAGLEEFSFHILRHTRLTLDFADQSIPQTDILVMRRVSLEVAIEHYIHPNKDHRKRMVQNNSSNLSNDVLTLMTGLKLYLLEEGQNARS